MTPERLLEIFRGNQVGHLSKTDWQQVINDMINFIFEIKINLRPLGSLMMLEGVHKPFALAKNNPRIIDNPDFPEGLNTLAI